MLLETRAVEPFFKNGFVLACEESRDGVIIDPGDEVALLLDIVFREQLTIRYILLTHAHVDHITGVKRAKEAVAAPVGLHPTTTFCTKVRFSRVSCLGCASKRRRRSTSSMPPAPCTGSVDTRRVYITRRATVRGASACRSASRGQQGRQLFVGDTLFAGSIGRTDLPGGDYATLIRSIREVLFAFGDDVRVYPGHGPATTIGHERRANPFVAE